MPIGCSTISRPALAAGLPPDASRFISLVSRFSSPSDNPLTSPVMKHPNSIALEIVGAESLGVRSLCCAVTWEDRRILIDPGLALGYFRHGRYPHPVQVAVGKRVRRRILTLMEEATDVVFSHFHGDHVPLKDANPFQVSLLTLPRRFEELRIWSKAADAESDKMRRRFCDLQELVGDKLTVAEERSAGPLAFSPAVPHGRPGSKLGKVMMTRVDTGKRVFVHASDIQLLNAEAVEKILQWQPDIVLAAGPPLYLQRLEQSALDDAWDNALRLAEGVDTLILDHHLMRSQTGEGWLVELSHTAGRQVYCAADFMKRPRLLLEAWRDRLYEALPVPDGWMDDYAQGRFDVEPFLESALSQGVIPSIV